MTLEILAHPLLALPVGIIAGPLVSLVLSRRWIARGYGVWGILGGMGALAIAFWLHQFALGQAYAQSFAEIGPCSLCYEWSFMPFVISWVGWLIGAILFAAISVLIIHRRPRDMDRPPVEVWLGATIVALIIAGLTFAHHLAGDFRRADLRVTLQDVQEPITGPPLREVGFVDLRNMGLNPIRGVRYPEKLEFNHDGRWMSVLYDDGAIELWNMETLSQLNVVHAGGHPGIMGDFSPDGGTYLAWWEGGLMAFDVGPEKAGRRWERSLEYDNLVLRRDSGELVVLDFEGDVLRLDLATGETMTSFTPVAFSYSQLFTVDETTGEQIQIEPPPGVLYAGEHLIDHRLSPTGEVVAVRVDETVQLFDVRQGERFETLDLQAMLGSVEIEGWIDFRPDGRLVWVSGFEAKPYIDLWVPEERVAAPALDPALKALEEMADPYLSRGVDIPYALSPIEDIVVVGEAIWDFSEEDFIGEVPVEAAVTALTFSPDGRLLVVGTAGGTLRFFARSESQP